MISVVSSCSASGWKEYGERFVDTFLRHWPVEVKLHVVSEDSVDLPDGVSFHALWDSKSARDFERRHRKQQRSHGKVREPNAAGWTPKKVADGYNFRYDAYRFAKKVFAIEQVARSLPGGKLFWIDADVVTFANVPVEALNRLLPDTCAISCLDRTPYHSECGFVGYNLDHTATRKFITAFADIYASDKVFSLREWHDSWVFDWLRKDMNIPAYHIPHKSRSQPFINSELSQWLDHLKGSRKTAGRTPKGDRVLRDNVAYWA